MNYQIMKWHSTHSNTKQDSEDTDDCNKILKLIIIPYSKCLDLTASEAEHAQKVSRESGLYTC